MLSFRNGGGILAFDIIAFGFEMLHQKTVGAFE